MFFCSPLQKPMSAGPKHVNWKKFAPTLMTAEPQNWKYQIGRHNVILHFSSNFFMRKLNVNSYFIEYSVLLLSLSLKQFVL